jgi:voltage-gated potassium channel Kch
MKIDHIYAAVKTILKTNMDIVVLSILAALIVIFGGIGVYLAEHHHEGANITKLGDALWWAVVTVATVGYGDYYPVTTVGRIIAVFMMLSGIGIFVLLVGSLSQRRLQKTELRLKRKTQAGLLGDEEKVAIRNKIDEIEKLTKEVHTLLGED